MFASSSIRCSQERSFGAIRGTPYDRLTVDIFAPDYQPPEGEGWEVFHARVDRAWALMRRVAAETEGHLAVVTHGLVCRSLAARHLILPEGQEAPERWTNTGLTIADGPAPWRVRLLNCSVHLDGDLADWRQRHRPGLIGVKNRDHPGG